MEKGGRGGAAKFYPIRGYRTQHKYIDFNRCTAIFVSLSVFAKNSFNLHNRNGLVSFFALHTLI